MLQDDNKVNLTAPTPGDRLNVLIRKYFYSQAEFADKTGLSEYMISTYTRNRTVKIPNKNLAIIRDKVGFNPDFLSSGTGEELIEGCELKPLLSNVVLHSQARPVAPQKVRAGVDVKQCVIVTSGRNDALSELGTANVMDTVCDGLQNPTLVLTLSADFCEHYELPKPGQLVIDKGNFRVGDVVLIKYSDKFYLADYEPNILTCHKRKTEPEFPFEESEIIGKVYSLVCYF